MSSKRSECGAAKRMQLESTYWRNMKVHVLSWQKVQELKEKNHQIDCKKINNIKSKQMHSALTDFTDWTKQIHSEVFHNNNWKDRKHE